ncbi:MAG: AAA family ATPase, partial [Synergistales bacterium]|nr:AAA family ATPase [Synergistales bacterium]
MGKESPAQKPTRDETAINLLRLGHLLHQFSHPKGVFGFSRPIRPDEAKRLREEIGALEKRIEEAVADSRQWLLRGVFGLRGRESVDAIAIRIVACVAWSAMVSDRPEAGIASVANSVAMGDWGSHLEARKTIRQLVARGTAIQIGNSDYHGDVLSPNSRFVRFLSTDDLPILFSAKSIQAERDEWQRQRQGEVLKKVHTPRQATTEASTDVSQASVSADPLQSPKAICSALSKTVIGMEPATMRRFSVAMSLHLRRADLIRRGIVPTAPNQILCVAGESGVGKTYLIEEFCKIAGLPYAIGNLAECTSSGYAGMDLNDILVGLFRGGAKRSEIEAGAMVCLDEADKRRLNERHGAHDCVGEGLQGELLRIVEGTDVQLGGRRANDPVKGTLSTRGICFALVGCFDGLEKAMSESNRKRPIGFGGDTDPGGRRPDIREALGAYFLPELCNRISTIL